MLVIINCAAGQSVIQSSAPVPCLSLMYPFLVNAHQYISTVEIEHYTVLHFGATFSKAKVHNYWSTILYSLGHFWDSLGHFWHITIGTTILYYTLLLVLLKEVQFNYFL
jgi:hypothetical protein